MTFFDAQPELKAWFSRHIHTFKRSVLALSDLGVNIEPIDMIGFGVFRNMFPLNQVLVIDNFR